MSTIKTPESLYLRDNAYYQAKSLLGNITAKLDISEHCIADEELLITILNSQEVKTELELIAMLHCQHGVTNKFLKIFVPIFRLGVRVGALYEIKDCKKD